MIAPTPVRPQQPRFLPKQAPFETLIVAPKPRRQYPLDLSPTSSGSSSPIDGPPSPQSMLPDIALMTPRDIPERPKQFVPGQRPQEAGQTVPSMPRHLRVF